MLFVFSSKSLIAVSTMEGTDFRSQDPFTYSFELKSLSYSLSKSANWSCTEYRSYSKSIGFLSFYFSVMPCPSPRSRVLNSVSIIRLSMLHILCSRKLSDFLGMLSGSVYFRRWSKFSRGVHWGSV